MSNTKLSFGKYQGYGAAELNSSYLLWLAGQAFMKVQHPDLLVDCLIEVRLRLNNGRLVSDLLGEQLVTYIGGFKSLNGSQQ